MSPRLVKSLTEKIVIGAGLIALSFGLASIHYAVYQDSKYIQSYFLLHLAFLPLHALGIGLVLDGLLSFREQRTRLKKMSMLLGIFFRQVGVDLFVLMAAMVENRDEFDEQVMVQPEWNPRRFRMAEAAVRTTRFRIRTDRRLLAELVRTLREKEGAILEMTRSPHLLEFEDFHHGLISLFHLIEELHFHPDWAELGPASLDHLAQDITKALKALAVLWLQYLQHLKRHHPVLFSHQTGIHNVIDPNLLQEDWEED